MNSYFGRFKRSEARWLVILGLAGMALTYQWTENVWATILSGVLAGLFENATLSITQRLDVVIERLQK